MSEANDDQVEVEEQPTQVNEPDLILVEAEPENEPRGELLKFGLLAIVLLFTVLIIALLRPYIFNTLIPAVLGEGQPVAPLVRNESEAEVIKPVMDEEEAVDEREQVEEIEEEELVDMAVSTPEATEEAAPEPVNPEDFPTAVPAQTHTVQAGENLTTIAQRYGTTVQAIVAANQISNPDRVNAGTVLTIPDSQ
jgi:LysM repeat protein